MPNAELMNDKVAIADVMATLNLIIKDEFHSVVTVMYDSLDALQITNGPAYDIAAAAAAEDPSKFDEQVERVEAALRQKIEMMGPDDTIDVRDICEAYVDLWEVYVIGYIVIHFLDEFPDGDDQASADAATNAMMSNADAQRAVLTDIVSATPARMYMEVMTAVHANDQDYWHDKDDDEIDE